MNKYQRPMQWHPSGRHTIVKIFGVGNVTTKGGKGFSVYGVGLLRCTLPLDMMQYKHVM